MSEPHLIALTCEPHTVRSQAVSIDPSVMDVMSSDYTHVRPCPVLYYTVNYLCMQYNARTKQLHLDARIHCVHGAAGALRVQPLQGHTGTREVVSDKASKLSTQTQSAKHCK